MDGSHFGCEQKFFKNTLISPHPLPQTLKFRGGILGGPLE
jgi:hypothetical protein